MDGLEQLSELAALAAGFESAAETNELWFAVITDTLTPDQAEAVLKEYLKRRKSNADTFDHKTMQ